MYHPTCQTIETKPFSPITNMRNVLAPIVLMVDSIAELSQKFRSELLTKLLVVVLSGNYIGEGYRHNV